MKHLVILSCLLAAVIFASGDSPKSELKIDSVYVPEGCESKSKNGDMLTMHYTGTLSDGTKFDSRLAIVGNVLLAEGSPICLGKNNDDEPNYQYGVQFNNPLENVNMVVPSRPAYSHGENTIIRYIYQGPVFIYNNYAKDAKSPRKLMALDNNATKILKAKYNENYRPVELSNIESYFQKLLQNSKIFDRVKNGNERSVPDADEDSYEGELLDNKYEDNESFHPTNTLFEKILAKSEKLPYTTKSVEDLRNEIKKIIKKIMCDTLADYESTDEYSPELVEIWINEVMSYLNMMKRTTHSLDVVSYPNNSPILDEIISSPEVKDIQKAAEKLSATKYPTKSTEEISKEVKTKIENFISDTVEDSGTLYKNKKKSYLKKLRETLGNSRFAVLTSDEINSVPEISALIKEMRTKFLILSAIKSAEEISKEVKTDIEKVIRKINAHYESADKHDSDLDEIWTNKTVSYLKNYNEWLATKLDHFNQPKFLTLDEINSVPEISALIKEMRTKFQILSAIKSAEEISKEVKTDIEKVIRKINAHYESTDKHDSDLDEIWTNKTVSYLKNYNEWLATKLDHFNQPKFLTFDEINSVPEISALIKEMRTKFQILSAIKSAEEISKEVKTDIEKVIRKINAHYESTDKHDSDLDEIWTNKTVSYLKNYNEWLATKLDHFNQPMFLTFDEINSVPEISALIKEMRTKFQILSAIKSAEEISKEVKTDIEKVIRKINAHYESTDKHDSDLDEIWTNKTVSYLKNYNEWLATKLDHFNQPKFLTLDEINSVPEISALIKEMRTKFQILSAIKSAEEISKEVKTDIEKVIRKINAHYESTDKHDSDLDEIWTNKTVSYLKNYNEWLATKLDHFNQPKFLTFDEINSVPEISALIKEMRTKFQILSAIKSAEEISKEVKTDIEKVIRKINAHYESTDKHDSDLDEIWTNKTVSYLKNYNEWLATKLDHFNQPKFLTFDEINSVPEISALIKEMRTKFQILSAIKSAEEISKEVKTDIEKVIRKINAHYESTDKHDSDLDEIWTNKTVSYLKNYNEWLATKLDHFNQPKFLTLDEINSVPEISALIKEMRTKFQILSAIKSAEEISKEVKTDIEKVIRKINAHYESTDKHDSDLDEIWTNKTVSYLKNYNEWLATKLDHFNQPKFLTFDEINSVPEISALIKEMRTKFQILSAIKSAEEISKEVKTDIEKVIRKINAHYESTDKHDSDLDEIWTNKTVSYLKNYNEWLATKLDHFNQPKFLTLDEINSVPEISALIKEMRTKFQILSAIKSAEEISKEVKTDIEKVIRKINAHYESTDKHDSDLDEIWTNKTVSYLKNYNEWLATKLDHFNQPKFLTFDEINSVPEISALIKEMRTKFQILSAIKSAEEISKEVKTDIEKVIRKINAHYESADKHDSGLDEIWTNKTVSYLKNYNEWLATKLDHFNQPKSRTLDEINSVPEISALIKEMRTKFQILSAIKSAEEISKEVKTDIEKVIRKINAHYESTDKHDSDLDEIWTNKTVSYLKNYNEWLATKLDHFNQPKFLTFDEINSVPEISALIKEMRTKFQILSAIKSAEEISKEVKTDIEKVIRKINAHYESTDKHDSGLDEIWTNKTVSYLKNYNEWLATKLDHFNQPKSRTLDEINSVPEISALIKEMRTKFQILSAIKSAEEISKEVKTDIEKVIRKINAHYESTDKHDSDLDEIWTNKTVSYLKNYNEWLATKLDHFNQPKFLTFDEINSVPEISALIKDIQTKSEKLSATKYPTKSAEEISEEVKTKIENIISDTQLVSESTDEHSPELDKMWTKKMMSHLNDMNNDLAYELDKITLSPEISALLKEFRTKSETLSTMKYPTKSAEEIRKKVETIIENLINDINAGYESADKHDSDLDEIWTNKIVAYLKEYNKYLDDELDDVNQPNLLTFDEINSVPEISALIKDIQTKSEKLSATKYPTKSAEEISEEVKTKIENIISDTQLVSESTDEHTPELDKMWTKKMMSHLNDMNNDLAYELDKLTLSPEISALIKEMRTKLQILEATKYPTKSAEEIRNKVEGNMENFYNDVHDTDDSEERTDEIVSYIKKFNKGLDNKLDYLNQQS